MNLFLMKMAIYSFSSNCAPPCIIRLFLLWCCSTITISKTTCSSTGIVEALISSTTILSSTSSSSSSSLEDIADDQPPLPPLLSLFNSHSPPIRAISFDVTGTLLATREPVVNSYYDAAVWSQLPTPLPTHEEFKMAFTSAFRGRSIASPCFGGVEGISGRDWWKTTIRRVLDNAYAYNAATTTNKKSDGSSSSSSSSNYYTEEEFQRYFRRIYQHFGSPAGYRVLEDAQLLLSSLEQRGHEGPGTNQQQRDENNNNNVLVLGITSNTPLRHMDSVLPMLNNFHDQFSWFTCSQEVGHEKPSPELFDHAYQQAKFWCEEEQEKSITTTTSADSVLVDEMWEENLAASKSKKKSKLQEDVDDDVDDDHGYNYDDCNIFDDDTECSIFEIEYQQAQLFMDDNHNTTTTDNTKPSTSTRSTSKRTSSSSTSSRRRPLQKNEVLHIGDSYTCDYCGAKAYGFQALFLDRSEHPSVMAYQDWLEAPEYPGKSLEDVQQHTITSLTEVLGILQQQQQQQL